VRRDLSQSVDDYFTTVFIFRSRKEQVHHWFKLQASSFKQQKTVVFTQPSRIHIVQEASIVQLKSNLFIRRLLASMRCCGSSRSFGYRLDPRYLVSVLAFLIAFLPLVANGQRVISSLGAKLKRKTVSSGSQGDHVIQGEDNTSAIIFADWTSVVQDKKVEFFIAGIIVMVTSYLFARRSKPEAKGEEGEFS
jgi:hypothetical protein